MKKIRNKKSPKNRTHQQTTDRITRSNKIYNPECRALLVQEINYSIKNTYVDNNLRMYIYVVLFTDCHIVHITVRVS